MTGSIIHYQLPLKHAFTLGNGTSRTHTPISIIKLSYNGCFGMGEAAMPPYLGENHQTATEFFQLIDFNRLLPYPFQFEKIHDYLDQLKSGNYAIKAAIDIALHDLWGKLENAPVNQLLQTNHLLTPITAGTIGISPLSELPRKVDEILQAGFLKIKVKLGGEHDIATVKTIRKLTHLPMSADVNQGWTDLHQAIDYTAQLAELGVVMLEQPFSKEQLQLHGLLKEVSPLPVFADESCQQLADLEKIAPYFDGVNIKLMKCGGLWKAQQIVGRAKTLGLKAMLGCMTETSCATLAASTIAPLFDFVDIDGPWLLKEQPFESPNIQLGRIENNLLPGLGLTEK